MNHYYVYILAGTQKALYIGITNDLIKRVWQHKEKQSDGFTKKYNINQLVYYEETADIKVAIAREKQLKKWNREWKLELITKNNPAWEDLYYKIVE